MPVYIAMLRGVNVSGHKPMKMELLRASFESLGYSDVKTYVQSGNVVFRAARISEAGLTEKLTKTILDQFKYSVSIIIRTPEEFSAILKHNPFVRQADGDEARLYVTFLSQPAPKGTEALLKPLAVASEQFVAHGREIYLCCPNGYGNTKISNTAIEKKLSLQATTRNWRTVNALFEMAKL